MRRRRVRAVLADVYGVAWFVWVALDWRLHRRDRVGQ